MSDQEYIRELEDTITDAAAVYKETIKQFEARGVELVQVDERVAALLTQAEFIEARRANPVAALLEDVDRETRRRMGEGGL